MEYCTIDGASTNVTCISSRPTISHCTFQNSSLHIEGYYNSGTTQWIEYNTFESGDCGAIYLDDHKAYIRNNTIYGYDYDTDGISVYNNLTPEDTPIYQNDLTSHSSGIFFYDASAVIQENDIYDNTVGINSNYYSHPYLRENNSDILNVITDNAYGIVVGYISVADLNWGWNTVAANSIKNISTNYYSMAYARGNYWGNVPPDANKIQGDVDYSYYLTQDETGRYPSGYMKPVTVKNATALLDSTLSPDDDERLTAKFNEAHERENEKSYDAAALLYSAIVDSFPDKSLTVLALRQMIVCNEKTQHHDQIYSELQNIRTKHGNEKIGGWAWRYTIPFLTEAGKFDEALVTCQKIRSQYKNDDLLKSVLNTEWSMSYHVMKNEKYAEEIVKQYESDYGVDKILIHMKFSMGKISGDEAKGLKREYETRMIREQQQTTILPKVFALHNNYPNPFNPDTRIPFDLPEAAHVKIDIYDITGRLVMSLINENYEAGRHVAVLHGDRFPSGMYLAQATMTLSNHPETSYKFRNKMMLVK
ncbi:T9SS type A sorting domain-containing protein [candidate division KSB1 bacterium]|nr:T9SS type A sorting domain-containing protein [candidate division KSB1 bacterium]